MPRLLLEESGASLFLIGLLATSLQLADELAEDASHTL